MTEIPFDPDVEFENLHLVPSQKSLGDARVMVRQLLYAEKEIKTLQANIDARQHEINLIMNTLLPDLMLTLGMDELPLKDGRVIEIIDILSMSISEERRPLVIEWLKKHGGEELIIPTITYEFKREDNDIAYDVLNDVMQIHAIMGDLKEAFNTQSLKAWCRKQLAKGVELPKELLGFFQGRVAKFREVPKSEKGK